MKPDISVIVPVYNVEPYLPRCLDSLCAQDYQNLEFLLVDDGSTDKCGMICDRYAEEDVRFRVFHKENGGLSSARNYALDKADGRYVMFVDSDDWVTPDFCSTALGVAEQKKADVVMFAFREVNGKRKIGKKLFPEEGFKARQEIIDLLWGRIGNVVWNKLYKRELFQGIRFPEGRLYEDIAVTYQVIYKANTIYFTPQSLYYYFIRKSSISHQKTVYSMQELFEMQRAQFEKLQGYGFSEKKKELYLQKLAIQQAITLKKNPHDRNSVWAHQILQSMQNAPSNSSLRCKMMFRLYKISPKLFDLCCIIWRRRVT